MAYLMLKRASTSRPSGDWNDDDFDVLADGAVFGRIFKVHAAPVGSPWMGSPSDGVGSRWRSLGFAPLPAERRVIVLYAAASFRTLAKAGATSAMKRAISSLTC